MSGPTPLAVIARQRDGAPVGLSLAAAAGQDRAVLAAARAR